MLEAYWASCFHAKQGEWQNRLILFPVGLLVFSLFLHLQKLRKKSSWGEKSIFFIQARKCPVLAVGAAWNWVHIICFCGMGVDFSWGHFGCLEEDISWQTFELFDWQGGHKDLWYVEIFKSPDSYSRSNSSTVLRELEDIFVDIFCSKTWLQANSCRVWKAGMLFHLQKKAWV
jgi:hypothetical protein